jgi:hypothetical protein
LLAVRDAPEKQLIRPAVALQAGVVRRKIEVRDLKPKTWRIRIEKIINQDFIFDGANTISRISGCSLQQARELLNDLPNTLITPLYRPQAQRLLRALKKMQIVALLVKTQGSHLDS